MESRPPCQGYVVGPAVYYLGVYGYADAVYNASCELSDVVQAYLSNPP